jgi:hypothetical protein
MFLPDVFIQCVRTAMRPRGKRCFGFQAFVHGVVKEIVERGMITLLILERFFILRDAICVTRIRNFPHLPAPVSIRA